MSDDFEHLMPAPEGHGADAEPSPVKQKPPSKRRLNRVAAMQFLYAEQANPHESLSEALYWFFTRQEHPRPWYGFAEALAEGAWQQRKEIDDVIQAHTRNWDFERIARVDLAILRLAIHELLHRRDIPPIVSINEAIDLSKTYSSPDSKRFINGILDRMKDSLDRPLRKAAE
jgi:N utilization substance protein B